MNNFHSTKSKLLLNFAVLLSLLTLINAESESERLSRQNIFESQLIFNENKN